MSWRARVASERPGEVADVWRDGCAALARNACELVRAAGLPVTKRTVLSVLDGMTLDAWPNCFSCGRYLKQLADEEQAGRVFDEPTFALCEYFISYLGQMRGPARRMLEESFRGFLEGLVLDSDLPLAMDLTEGES